MSATKPRTENPNQPRVKRNTRAGPSESFVDLVKHHRRIARGSVSSLLQTPASSLVTLFVVAVALLLPALLFGLNSNLASLLAGFQDSAQVTLYLQNNVYPTRIQLILSWVSGINVTKTGKCFKNS